MKTNDSLVMVFLQIPVLIMKIKNLTKVIWVRKFIVDFTARGQSSL